MPIHKSKNIILLHGWSASAEKLQPLAWSLSRRGWNVFVSELPGFGKLPLSKEWNLNNYALYVIEKIEERFGNRDFFIFGHSFGGMIAIKLSSIYRKKNLVGIILCATSGISRASFFKRYFFLVIAKIGKMLSWLLPPKAKHFLRKLLYKITSTNDYANTEGAMRITFKNIISENLKREIKSLNIPILVFWGKKDTFTKLSDAYFIKNSIPTAKIIVYEDGDHLIPYRKPEDVAHHIDEWAFRNK